jgi:hypothetical protein
MLAQPLDFCNVRQTMKSVVPPRVVISLVVFSGLIFARAAPAASGKRVAVHVAGQGGPAIEKQISVALKKHGIAPVPLHGGADEAHLPAVARRLKIAAFVAGDVSEHGTRAQLKARGADGGVLAEGAWTVAAGGKKLAAAVGRSVWSRLGSALDGASAPSPPPRKARSEPAVSALAAADPPAPKPVSLQPAPPPPPAAADAEGSEFGEAPVKPRRGADESLEREGDHGSFGSGGPAALDASVGPRLMSRDLSWNKDIRDVMAPISVGSTPAIGFLVAWYPAAHFRGGWPSYIGLVVSGEFTPGGNAQAAGGGTYPTTGNDYWGGLRVRVPFSDFDGSLTLGYGQQTAFIHDGTNAPRVNLAAPDMAYSYLRIGADARVHLPARFSLLAGLAYRAVLDAGKDGSGAQTTAFFPKSTLTALDANAAVGYRFTALIEARVGVDLRRYGFDMHPTAMDARIVSGAIDQYIAYWLNLAVLFDGKS